MCFIAPARLHGRADEPFDFIREIVARVPAVRKDLQALRQVRRGETRHCDRPVPAGHTRRADRQRVRQSGNINVDAGFYA